MDTVKVRITIGLGEAIRAGKSEYGKKIVEFHPADYTPEEREAFLRLPWVYAAETGSRSAENLPDLNHAAGIPMGIDGSVEDIKRLLAANAVIQAKEAKEKAETAARERATLEAEANWLLHVSLDDCVVKAQFEDKFQVHHRLRALLGKSRDAEDMFKLAQGICDEKNAEIKAQFQAAQAAKELAKIDAENKAAALLQEKREYISAWVTQHGSESQKARLVAGLLPMKEVEDVMRDDCFANIDRVGFERYTRMDHDDLDCTGCDPDDTIFSVEDSTEATHEEFEVLSAIKKLSGDAKCVLRTHTGECRCSTCAKKSVLVTVNCGPFVFSREYAV